MKSQQMNCKTAAAAMPDLLFDPAAATPEARAHVEACRECGTELASLRYTIDVLDKWEAPEPTPFWTSRMEARLREEQARPATGWAGFKERLHTRLWLSNHSLRPVAGVAALSLLLTLGGGAWLDLSQQPITTPAQASNTVRDLQSLNENAVVFQQLSALDTPEGSASSGGVND